MLLIVVQGEVPNELLRFNCFAPLPTSTKQDGPWAWVWFETRRVGPTESADWPTLGTYVASDTRRGCGQWCQDDRITEKKIRILFAEASTTTTKLMTHFMWDCP